MQRHQHIAKMKRIGQRKGKVTTQVHQVAGTYCIRSPLCKIVGKTFQALCDVSRHIALLLNILYAPRNMLALAVQVVTL